jgi:hypothetical protein
MDDALQSLALLLVTENDLSDRGPVHLPFFRDSPRAEGLDDLGQSLAAGGDDLAGQRVRVDHDRAQFRQPPGDRALARRDPARQPHHQHAPSLPRHPRKIH